MSAEIDFKVHFAERYFDKSTCQYDINYVDIVLTLPRKTKSSEYSELSEYSDRKGSIPPLLYIEAKDRLTRGSEPWKRALAQIILTNKKQSRILDKVALIYRNETNDDCLDLIDCSENSIMYNNDIPWNVEKPNNPSKDTIDHIFNRIHNRISFYTNREIAELYKQLKAGQEVQIHITLSNFNVVYNEWCNTIQFANREIKNEQDRINLFLVDLLNGTKYEKSVKGEFFGQQTHYEHRLIREGTDLNKYTISHHPTVLTYDKRDVYYIEDEECYEAFWLKYRRPPEQSEFMKILEQSARLYTDAYRRDTGGFYTPSCFVQLQNRKLSELGYNLNEYVVCDPCCGVGNLENEFGKEYKAYCYMSTLESMDVDICKIKGFDNVVQFDFLSVSADALCRSANVSQATGVCNAGDTLTSRQPLPENAFPKWLYHGEWHSINEICQMEHRKLMVIMNPPYVKQKGFKNNLAIEFFNKVLAWQPNTIVFYYETSSFLREEIQNYINSGYKVVSHVLTNAKTSFQISEWAASQVVFDKVKGEPIQVSDMPIERWEVKKDQMIYVKTYHYDQSRLYLIKEIEKKIKECATGPIIGQWSYLNSVIKIGNGGKEKSSKITTHNLVWCLLSKGINFNTHHKYFELNDYTYRGRVEEIPAELFNDSIAFSLFYKGFLFSNKGGYRNYIMPFTADMLGCNPNALNVLHQSANLFSENSKFSEFSENSENSEKSEYSEKNGEFFDFRQWLTQFDFSQEAKELFLAALNIFRWYHSNPQFAKNRDWNDSWYDITNAIMGKDDSSFQTLDEDEDKRFLYKVRTTKGTRGFGRNTIKSAVLSKDLPIFYHFFDVRDALARKINRELLDAGLLLWERENIY